MNMGVETKSLNLGGEMLEVVLSEQNFEYEEFRSVLIPEWQEVTDRLSQTGKGRELLGATRFCDSVVRNSEALTDILHLVSQKNTSPSHFTYRQLRDMYYLHPSLIDMSQRVGVLEFIAKGLSPEVKQLEEAGNYEKAMVRTRRLASVYEEIGVLKKEPFGEDSDRALELNQAVSQSPHLNIGLSPRKLHARFAIYDIWLRRLTEGYTLKDQESIEKELSGLQANAFFELSEVVQTARSIKPNRGTISGEVGELVLQRRGIDRMIAAGVATRLEFRQGFIRQDYTDESYGKRMAFDLALVDHQTDKMQPIEVKKLSRDTGTNGKPFSWVPIIDVARFRIGRNSDEYLEIVDEYCRQKLQQYVTGEQLTSDVIESVESKLDPEITRLLVRLNAPFETSTNYEHGPDGHPTMYEFAEEIALST